MSNKYTKRKRKVQNRQIDKVVDRVNRSIRRDNLWRGRFEAIITERYSYPFSDGSGIEAIVYVVYYDHAIKEPIYAEVYHHIKSIGNDNNCDFWRKSLLSKLYLGMNKAIVEKSNVYTEGGKSPYELAKLPEYNFTKAKSPNREELRRISREDYTIWGDCR